jgi:hypothetical protein
VRTPEQIVAALFRDDTVPQPPARREPCFKRYRAYFAETGAAGEPTVPSAYPTWAWLAKEVQTRHQGGQPIIRLMDGQPSLWEAAAACLDEFVAELPDGHQPPQLVDILDIIHVSGDVWKAAKVVHSHKEHQEAFAQDRLLRILHGDVVGVITGLRRMASQRHLKQEALKTVTTACHYFEINAQRMRYDEYL